MSVLLKKVERFTYADYCKWDDGQRWELIDGEAYAMALSGVVHQRVLTKVVSRFGPFLEGKKCEVFVAPMDVRLNVDKGDDTVVQPDLLVVCDPKKIDKNSINGAPDLVVEILSPSTLKYDKVQKYAKCKEAGVAEIWFVDPANSAVEVHKQESNQYSFSVYIGEDKITVDFLPEFEIDLQDIFENSILENTEEAQEKKEN